MCSFKPQLLCIQLMSAWLPHTDSVAYSCGCLKNVIYCFLPNGHLEAEVCVIVLACRHYSCAQWASSARRGVSLPDGGTEQLPGVLGDQLCRWFSLWKGWWVLRTLWLSWVRWLMSSQSRRTWMSVLQMLKSVLYYITLYVSIVCFFVFFFLSNLQ